ncbi:MAG: phosphatidylinositol-3-phosphatase [Acidimicrobiales bacterium]
MTFRPSRRAAVLTVPLAIVAAVATVFAAGTGLPALVASRSHTVAANAVAASGPADVRAAQPPSRTSDGPAGRPADAGRKQGASRPGSTATVLPPVGHVFVINLENKGLDAAFGPTSPATYLSQTLRGQGMLLSQYYGTAHNSLPNYLAQISGQGPNTETQGDCQIYSDFVGQTTTTAQQAVGQGCVYPPSVHTIADQLQAKGLSWKGYMEDMGNAVPAQPATCRHPALNAPDPTQTAHVGDQYAARHDPFVYFHSVIDSPTCAADVVPLTALPGALASASTTPNLTYITPNLCHDGHDRPCVDGEPGGLVSADAFLKTWVPKILASPAYQTDGLLIVTFDESDNPAQDASACCGEGPGPNSPLPGISGLGGGRVGTVAVSRWIRPGSYNDTPYNHYGLLASMEDLFGLSHLGYAATAPYRFARDVFNNYP